MSRILVAISGRVLAGALAVGLGLAGPGRAGAQALEVTPIQLSLAAEARSGLVTLHNQGTEPVRYQVSVFAWEQDRAGEMQLAGTRDVQFFPSVLTVGPGEKRNLRVAAAAPFGAVEKPYRLFVTELPDRTKAPEGRVKVLTRVGIPVFLEPREQVVRAEATALELSGGRFSFVLRNTGTVRIRPELVRAVGRDAGGAIVLDERIPCWYVLAGGERALQVAVPAEACGRLATLAAEINVGQGKVEATLPLVPGACSR